MKTYNKKNCTNFMPLDDNISYGQPNCNHCAYYSTKNCFKASMDNLDYPEDDIDY